MRPHVSAAPPILLVSRRAIRCGWYERRYVDTAEPAPGRRKGLTAVAFACIGYIQVLIGNWIINFRAPAPTRPTTPSTGSQPAPAGRPRPTPPAHQTRAQRDQAAKMAEAPRPSRRRTEEPVRPALPGEPKRPPVSSDRPLESEPTREVTRPGTTPGVPSPPVGEPLLEASRIPEAPAALRPQSLRQAQCATS